MTFRLSPLWGSVLNIQSGSLGLTPQAMHMSLLRSFQAPVHELWCGRLGCTSSIFFENVRAGRPHHKGSPALSVRFRGNQKKDEPRSCNNGQMSPSFGAEERRQIFSLGREPQEHDPPNRTSRGAAADFRAGV